MGGTGVPPVELLERQWQQSSTIGVEGMVVLIGVPHLLAEEEEQSAALLDVTLQRRDRALPWGRDVAQRDAVESIEGGRLNLTGIDHLHPDPG